MTIIVRKFSILKKHLIFASHLCKAFNISREMPLIPCPHSVSVREHGISWEDYFSATMNGKYSTEYESVITFERSTMSVRISSRGSFWLSTLMVKVLAS